LELDNSGHQIGYWFEEFISGAVPAFERPVFKEMVGKMRAGETLLVSRLDRLGRDCVDVVSTVRELQSRDIKVVVLQMGNLDLTSTVGTMMMTVLSCVAEMERSLLIERTQSGIARARAEGVKFGRPVKVTDKVKREVLQKLSEGTSVSQTARDLGLARNTVLKARKTALAEM
jgi:DNA invertase Pin-like site-specific DNA recombinase